VTKHNVGFAMALKRRHGDVIRDDGGSGASELVSSSLHIGTHIDALAHTSVDGKLFGGVDAATAQRSGFKSHGVDQIEPMICRGVMIDLVSSDGPLKPAYEITPADLETASKGLELESASVILIRTGWAAYWDEPEFYVGSHEGVPGMGFDAAQWLASHAPIAVGSDTMAFDCIPAGAGHKNLPAHSFLLVEKGIYIIENLNLDRLADAQANEFLFVLTPLSIVGATGSPVRPVALVK
jgi:kynurenine formamidase